MLSAIESALPSYAAKLVSSAAQTGTSTRNRAAEQAREAEIARLKQRDSEVRAHEAAHMATGGGLVQGGPSFVYRRGPDGKLYATGGEVSINTSPGRDPQDTLRRAEQIRAAALAPAQPSSQDYAVAAEATQMANSAQRELNQARLGGNAEGAASKQPENDAGNAADNGAIANAATNTADANKINANKAANAQGQNSTRGPEQAYAIAALEPRTNGLSLIAG